MNNDVLVLKLLSSKEAFDKYSDFVKIDYLDLEIREIFKALKLYMQFCDENPVDFNNFSTWFLQSYISDIKEDQAKIYKLIFEQIQRVETVVADNILLGLQEKYTKENIIRSLEKEVNVDVLKEYVEEYEKIKNSIITGEDEHFVKNSLEDIISITNPKEGLNWKLNCLNDSIGPLSLGKLVIIAAYVDVGKTMLAISEATHMAKQLKSGCVLWLNNEEEDYRVYKKIWKSVLNCNDKTLEKNIEAAREVYTERMNGDIDRIKFINIRSMGIRDIKKLFKKYNPKLVVIDQVDKITLPGVKSFSDHDRLKSLYGEVRALTNEYCPVIAISQADASTARLNKDTGDIEYTLYPHHRQLDGSKVGKPGEADAIIMIGRRADFPNTRGIHVSKNKFGNTIKEEVIFDGEKARYENP